MSKEVLCDNPEQRQLRAMTEEQRDHWFSINCRHKFSIHIWTIKVDGHLVATGNDDELEDMLLQFHKYIDGPDRPVRPGGMG